MMSVVLRACMFCSYTSMHNTIACRNTVYVDVYDRVLVVFPALLVGLMFINMLISFVC